MSSNEIEFLLNYNSDDFEKISLISDVLIFSISDENEENYRKLGNKKLSVLLVKRDNYPFKNVWSLPGEFMKMNESSVETTKRIIEKYTSLSNIYVEQLYTFDDVNRDPRMRIVSTSYMALINRKKMENDLLVNSAWFDITYEKINDKIVVALNNGNDELSFVTSINSQNSISDTYEYVIEENNGIAFDHPLAIINGVMRLKNKTNYTDIIFNLMDEYFTLGDLQKVYELVLNKKLLDPAFRRIIAKKVVKTNKISSGKGHRPAVLFKYKNDEI